MHTTTPAIAFWMFTGLAHGATPFTTRGVPDHAGLAGPALLAWIGLVVFSCVNRGART